MYFLLEEVNVHCHVSLLEGIIKCHRLWGFDSCFEVVLCGKFLKVYRLITEQKALWGQLGTGTLGGMGREEVTTWMSQEGSKWLVSRL